MFNKFEAEIQKEIDGQMVVFKVILVKINMDGIEHWVYSTSFSALSETGEAFSVKTIA